MRVLLVEDNQDDVVVMKRVLAGLGASDFALDAASSLAEGIAQLQRQPADIVLLDLSLPDSRGFETLTTLVARVPDVPVVVLTGLCDDATGVEAIRSGAQDYLVKGEFNGVFLMRVIQHAIERKRTERSLKELNDSLKKANGELTHMNSIMMDREQRILELKREINELRQRSGEKPKYSE